MRDTCADGIYSAHTIEHVPPYQTAEMLRNWYRVLKPGGRVEIRCPDLEWAWREFLAEKLPGVILDEIINGISTGPHQVHQNGYWQAKLVQMLSDAGFVRASRVSYGHTTPLLDFWHYDGKDRQSHGRPIPDLVVAAYRPPAGEQETERTRSVAVGSYERAISSILTRRERWLRFGRRVWHRVRRARPKRLVSGLLPARAGLRQLLLSPRTLSNTRPERG